MSPAGLVGTGVGAVGTGVAPIFPVFAPEAAAAVWCCVAAKAGEASAREATRAIRDKPDIFIMGDSILQAE
ncbi:hypothetical protein AA11237_2136 [Acidocella aminolytica 101 = DSM 11237]|nr:hypothetical protein AA11237_2136 [Acidocella aminolytica 101 = DSM 11237]